MKKNLLLMAALAGGPSLHAAITEYTNAATFLALLQPGYYQETFASLLPGDLGATLLPFSGGSPLINLTIETRNAPNTFPGDNLFLADLGNLDNALGTSTSQSDQLRISSPNFFAIGGEWFLSSLDEDYVPGSVTLTFSDGSTFSVASSTEADSFRGYISDSPLASVRVTGPGIEYVTVDNLVVGALVPEPGAASLLLLGTVAATARRRRS